MRNSKSIIKIILCITLLLNLGCIKKENKTINVGVVNSTSVLESSLDGFKKGMVGYGYNEGDNINYFYDGPLNDKESLEQAVQNFLNKKVDIILSITTPAAQAVKKITNRKKIPAVFMIVLDPVKSGIIAERKQPGGNMTGVLNGGINDLRLDWLIKIVSKVKRIYIPYNPDDIAPVIALGEVKEAAFRLNIELVMFETRNESDIEKSIREIPDTIQAIFLLNDSFVVTYLENFIDTSIKRKLPLSVPNIYQVEQGALMTCGFNPTDIGIQAARLANQILNNGVNPANIPVETAEFGLSINIKTADLIDLDIPDSILRQAQRIIR